MESFDPQDRYRTASRKMAATAAAVGLLVLAGWVFDVALFKSVMPGLVAMKANTAVCFVLLGAALWLLQERRAVRPPRPLLVRLAAGLCFTVAALTFFEYVSGQNLGLDQLLFTEAAGAVLTSSPGRMAFNTAIVFMLTSSALAALSLETELACLLAQALAVVSEIVGMVSLVGYIYDISPLYFGLNFSTAMAIHTSVLFILINLGCLCARPARGLMPAVTGAGYGSVVFRRLFMVALGLPILLGWIKLTAERRGWVAPEMGVSLVSIANTLVACSFVYLLSIYLNRLDAARRRAEADLQASQRLESLGLLAGGIAHDFNNLLVGIMGNLSLLRHKAGPDPELQELVRETAEAADRAKALSFRLLTFAKGGSPVKKAVDIGRLLSESAQFAARGSNCLCRIDLASQLPTALADENQLAQVFSNLVQNAIQAMPGGGVIEIKAEVRALGAASGLPLAPGEYLKLTFADNGPGIAAEVAPKIFEPYFSTKPAGHGLGLSISRSIITKHGGYIGAETARGKGAVFTVYLPVSAAGAAAAAAKAVKPAGAKGRVLLMDDEEIVARSVDRMLKELGLECVAVPDGARALEAYKAAASEGRPFEAVIMDLTIPGGMGGREAILKLREFAPGAKVLVSSGYSDDPVLTDHEKYGFDAVLGKPYRFEELAGALKGLLKK